MTYLSEQLEICKSFQEAFVKTLNASDELYRTRAIPFEQSVPYHLRPHTTQSSYAMAKREDHASALRNVSSASELCENVERAQTAQLRAKPIIRQPQPTLWDDEATVTTEDQYRTMLDRKFLSQ